MIDLASSFFLSIFQRTQPFLIHSIGGNMIKKMFVLIITLVILIAVANPAQAVTFGQPDTGNKFPHVGTLLFTHDMLSYYSCTGTLLSPTLMLTAGHCTAEAGQANLYTWVSFEPEISFANRPNYPSLIDFLNAEWIPATATPHPLFDDFNQWPDTYDVGIVTLSEPVILPVYGQLPELNFLESITKGKKQNSFTVVGYGMQGVINPFYSDIWARYYGTVKLVELNSAWNGDDASVKFTNNPGTGGGACYGDSGGPTFFQDTNIVVAVTSWGNTPCIGVDFEYRVDTATAQDFVKAFLP
jgi:hypothetical protein